MKASVVVLFNNMTDYIYNTTKPVRQVQDDSYLVKVANCCVRMEKSCHVSHRPIHTASSKSPPKADRALEHELTYSRGAQPCRAAILMPLQRM